MKFPYSSTCGDCSSSHFPLGATPICCPVICLRTLEIQSRQCPLAFTVFLLLSGSMPTDSHLVHYYFTHIVPCSEGRKGKMQTWQTLFCPGPHASHCKESPVNHLCQPEGHGYLDICRGQITKI